jgi:hypothetical protein
MRAAQNFNILLVISYWNDEEIFFKGMYFTLYVSLSDCDYFYAGEVSIKWIF